MMRWVLGMTLCAMLLPASLLAQDADKAEAARKAAERRAEWTVRSYNYLDLSESQKEQIKKILVENELSQSKLRDKQKVDINKLLTPDQKEKYESRNNRWRGNSYDQGSAYMRGQGLESNKIQKQLELTDEQAKKVKAIIKAAGDELIKQTNEMRKSGWDQKKYQELGAQARKDALEKIGPVLNEQQKAKLADVNKKWDERMEKWKKNYGANRGGSNGGGGLQMEGLKAFKNALDKTKKQLEKAHSKQGKNGNGTQGSKTMIPQPGPAQHLSQAMKALALPAEEAAVIQPLIKKLIDFKAASEKRLAQMRRDITTLASSGADEDKLTGRLTSLRKARAEYEAKLKLLEDGLRELLTIEQEAKMVGQGVLR